VTRLECELCIFEIALATTGSLFQETIRAWVHTGVNDKIQYID
jgi:hypothetical protein